jgi:hypothetical protein
MLPKSFSVMRGRDPNHPQGLLDMLLAKPGEKSLQAPCHFSHYVKLSIRKDVIHIV